MNLGIIIDSSTGITKKEATKKGWGFLPLYLNIDGKEYAEGIDLDTNSLSEKLSLESNVKTSASSPAEVLDLFEKFSKKYDEVIVFPLSTELSSQNNNLKIFAKEFKNINVINSKSLSLPTLRVIEKVLKENDGKKNIQELVQIANETTKTFFGIVAPKTLDWLVKGGRVNSSLASMANMLKIVPLIKLENGKLDRHGKGRTFNKSIIKAARYIIEEKKPKSLMVLHAGNPEIGEVVKNIKEITKLEVEVGLFPPSITLHIGLEAVSVAICD